MAESPALSVASALRNYAKLSTFAEEKQGSSECCPVFSAVKVDFNNQEKWLVCP